MKISINLGYRVSGPDRDDSKAIRNYLLNKKLYMEILYPYRFDSEDFKVKITDNNVLLEFNHMKLDDDLDFFRTNFLRNFNNNWTNTLFNFGKKHFYYDDHTLVEKDKYNLIHKYYNSYYILDSVILPIDSEFKDMKCSREKHDSELYFFNEVNFEKYGNDYFVSLSKIPEILRLKLKTNKTYGEYKLPKSLHSKVLKTYEYLELLAPEKISGKILLDLDQTINPLFIRYDEVEGYRLKDRIVYKIKPNNINFNNPKMHYCY